MLFDRFTLDLFIMLKWTCVIVLFCLQLFISEYLFIIYFFMIIIIIFLEEQE